MTEKSAKTPAPESYEVRKRRELKRRGWSEKRIAAFMEHQNFRYGSKTA